MRYYALIVASGSGKRMNDALPKQFSLLNGLPLLFHSVRAFATSAFAPEIILVLNEAHLPIWEELTVKYGFKTPVNVVSGGEERFHSVRNGLAKITEHGLVAIHDGVRPLIRTEMIDGLYNHAARSGSAIPGVQPAESVRISGKSENRSTVMLIQTPQVFHTMEISKAYEEAYRKEFTDDATVAENAGISLSFTEGNRDNIKITWPVDLEIASVLLK